MTQISTRRVALWLAVVPVLPACLMAHPVSAQAVRAGDFVMVPFGGLPVVGGMGGVQQALGAHLLWPAGSPAGLSGRYELRWDSDSRFYDAGSADVWRRVAGNDTADIALTGGWARWDHVDYGTVGFRARWPFIRLEEGGSAAVQGWFDLRYALASMEEARHLDGRVWAELMVGFVLYVRVGR